jgi:hypothetical protein
VKPTLVIAVAIALAVPTGSRAQSYAVNRGSWIVGGTAGFSSSGGDGGGDRITLLFLAPAGQYFVMPGLALGGQLRLSHSRSGSTGSTGYGAGPAATYYFGRGVRPVYPYLGASVSLARTSLSSGFGNDPPATTSTQFEPCAGLLLMLGRNVGVDTRLYYLSRHQHFSGVDHKTNEYGLAVGVSAFVF